MTEETTTATTEAPPVTTTTAPAPAATTAYGCCSDGAAHVMPMASALPVDCCSSSTECSQEGQPAVEEGPPVDDGALIDALREVIDPELMINIVDLGLVYSINHTDRKVNVEMTLTSPACPAGPQIIMQSKLALEKLNGIDVAEIKLTMSPPWTPARMTDEARDQLGIF
jgi:metal-sulfur cluster biosynthetic enzyme